MKYKAFEFDLDQIFPKRLRRIMRFIKKEIRLLVDYFAIDFIEWSNRAKSFFELALCLLLYKLFYPRQLFELVEQFGRSPFYLSRVLNDFLKHLEIRYDDILRWHSTLIYIRLKRYVKAMKRVERLGTKALYKGLSMKSFRGFANQM